MEWNQEGNLQTGSNHSDLSRKVQRANISRLFASFCP